MINAKHNNLFAGTLSLKSPIQNKLTNTFETKSEYRQTLSERRQTILPRLE